MSLGRKILTAASGNRFVAGQRPVHAKYAQPSHTRSQPVEPPVYPPQPGPKAVQAGLASVIARSIQPKGKVNLSSASRVYGSRRLAAPAPPKVAAVLQALSQPVAPPVYRPQSIPKVLQQKKAWGRQLFGGRPVPTSVAQRIGPAHATPGTLQRKIAGVAGTNPVAPAIYRPQPVPKVLQRRASVFRSASRSEARTGPLPPPVYRPQPVPRVLQKKMAVARTAQEIVGQQGSAPAATGLIRPNGEPPLLSGGKSAPGAKPSAVIQRLLGFEIEMLVLVDKAGESAPEKGKLGKYGQHLKLVVDQNQEIASDTPSEDDFKSDMRYASILEVVTKEYAPETVSGKTKILAAMQEAVTLANEIEQKVLLPRKRIKLGDIPNLTSRSENFFIGNASQTKQTTDASLQATMGLDIAQLAAYFESLQSQTLFVTKHHSDVEYNEGANAAKEMRNAAQIARAIVQEIGGKYQTPPPEREEKETALYDVTGLLALIAQYLRMGLIFHEGEGPLDKNLVCLLSRSNLSIIRKNLPGPQQDWLKDKQGEVKTRLLNKTGRTADAALFNKLGESQPQHNSWQDIKCGTFIDNVFTSDTDGVTQNFSQFKKIEPENINPEGTNKLGPVFELRNIAMPPSPFSFLPSGRIPRSKWLDLARYFVEVIGQLNTRSEDTQTGVTVAPPTTQPVNNNQPLPIVPPIRPTLTFLSQIGGNHNLKQTTTTVKTSFLMTDEQ